MHDLTSAMEELRTQLQEAPASLRMFDSSCGRLALYKSYSRLVSSDRLHSFYLRDPQDLNI